MDFGALGADSGLGNGISITDMPVLVPTAWAVIASVATLFAGILAFRMWPYMRAKWKTVEAELELLQRYFDLGDAFALRVLILKGGQLSEVASKLEHAEMQRAALDWEVAQRRRIAEELYRAVEAASSLSEYKSTFLANMSHELRTPLNGVIGVMRLLMDSELGPQQREYASIVQNSAQSLLAVVNEILDFSKLEAGKMSVECHPFDLRGAIEETVDLMAPQAAQKGLKLICSIDRSIGPRVESDAIKVRQIALNILGNAIKFTHEGRVVVRLELADGPTSGVRLVVEDTGIGIAPEAKQRIFESFTQADGSTTRRFGGTGLGLTISRRLAELLGGSLDCESEVGKGSKFTCVIPMGVERQSQARANGRFLVALEDDLEYEALGQSLDWLGFEPVRWRPDTCPDPSELNCVWMLAEVDSLSPERLESLKLAFGSNLILVRGPTRKGLAELHPTIDRPLHAGRIQRIVKGSLDGELFGKQILLIDDDPISLDLHSRSLRASGAQVVPISSSEEVAEVVNRRFDIIIVDLHLGGETAFDVIDRWSPLFADAKWLTHSASFSSKQCTDALKAGFADCLLKPLSSAAVAAACSESAVLANSAMPRERYLSPLDASRLEKQFDGDRSAVADVLARFAESSHELLRQLEQASGEGDVDLVIKLAHRLAGMSRTVGSEVLAEEASAIESISRSGDGDLAPHFKAAIEAWHQVCDNIETYVRRAA